MGFVIGSASLQKQAPVQRECIAALTTQRSEQSIPLFHGSVRNGFTLTAPVTLETIPGPAAGKICPVVLTGVHPKEVDFPVFRHASQQIEIGRRQTGNTKDRNARWNRLQHRLKLLPLHQLVPQLSSMRLRGRLRQPLPQSRLPSLVDGA